MEEWTAEDQARFEREEREDMEAERAFNQREAQHRAMLAQMARDEARHWGYSPAGTLFTVRALHGGGPGRISQSDPMGLPMTEEP